MTLAHPDHVYSITYSKLKGSTIKPQDAAINLEQEFKKKKAKKDR